LEFHFHLNPKINPMKKVVLSLLFVLATMFVMSQSVARQMVVVEDGTGTWCTYCPGAAMGCDDLLSHGKYVAVIANHNGSDPFVNVYSNARNTLWAVPGFPSVGFDGMQGLVGGNHSSSLYTSYVPIYNTRIAAPSEVSLSMEVTNTGLDYTAVVTITKVGTITSTNVALHFFVTQSNVQYNWQGQTHCEHINRLMVPDQSGTPVSFATGDVQTVTLNFTLNAAWPAEDCEFIAFLQDMTTGQGNQAGTGPPNGYIKKYYVFNGMKRGVIDLAPEFSASSTSVVTNTPVTFTNATTGGYIGVPETYEWIFPGGNPASSTLKDPTTSYAEAGIYDVTLIVNRGGQIDTLTKAAYITASWPVGMQEGQAITAATVSPNPSHGLVTLDVYSGKTVMVNVSVVNSINVPVYQETGISFTNRLSRVIDLSTIAKGIYFVVVEQDGSKTVKKVIIN
jgi:PKD repeat protein